MKTKVVFIILYFGKIPDYFELWAESACRNLEFDFLIFSDLSFDVKRYPNINTVFISFDEVQKIIKEKIDIPVKCAEPYKLCDYKAAYGYIFAEYIKDYEFWGFCDVDLIFGKISNYINDELLSKYDKILFQGHFSLQRNTEKINKIFMKKYDNVLDYEYSFSTDLICHFDENGTLAYCNEYENDITFYFGWIFFDTEINKYKITEWKSDEEVCFLWDNGVLVEYSKNGTKSQEYMYVHLQKRKMKKCFEGMSEQFIIMRDEFIEYNGDISYYFNIPIDNEKEKSFYHNYKKSSIRNKIDRIKKGWVKYKINSKIQKWRSQKVR
ncbi:MAG: hypothetical protein K6G88_11365, partial [Lachnospiraceae bacterium]|nr:hypothetical protein [Lachnospiraceae bacterium]